MKKFKVFTAILTVLLLSSFLAKEIHASQPSGVGDKWEIKSAKGPTTLKLGGLDIGWYIKIKNTGKVKSTGESITIKVTITYNGFTEYQEFNLTPNKTAAGKTTTLSVSCTSEKFFRPLGMNLTGTVGTKHLSLSFYVVEFKSQFNKDITINVQ